MTDDLSGLALLGWRLTALGLVFLLLGLLLVARKIRRPARWCLAVALILQPVTFVLAVMTGRYLQAGMAAASGLAIFIAFRVLRPVGKGGPR